MYVVPRLKDATTVAKRTRRREDSIAAAMSLEKSNTMCRTTYGDTDPPSAPTGPTTPLSSPPGASSHTRSLEYAPESDQGLCGIRDDGYNAQYEVFDDINTLGDPDDDHYDLSEDALSGSSSSGYSHDKDASEAVSVSDINNENNIAIAVMTYNSVDGGDGDVNETPSDPETFHPSHNATAANSDEDYAGDSYIALQSSHLTSGSDNDEGSDPRSCSFYSGGDEEEYINNVATSSHHAASMDHDDTYPGSDKSNDTSMVFEDSSDPQPQPFRKAEQPIDLSPGSFVLIEGDTHPHVIRRIELDENGEKCYYLHLCTSHPTFQKFKDQYGRHGRGNRHYVFIGGEEPRDPNRLTIQGILLPTEPELSMEGSLMPWHTYIETMECGPFQRGDLMPYRDQQHQISRSDLDQFHILLSTPHGPEAEFSSEHSRRATRNTHGRTPNSPHRRVQHSDPPRSSGRTANRGRREPRSVQRRRGNRSTAIYLVVFYPPSTFILVPLVPVYRFRG